MPTVTLLQKSDYSLIGINLVHGENELTDEQFEALSKEWGYSHAIEHGLIAPQPKPVAADKSKK